MPTYNYQKCDLDWISHCVLVAARLHATAIKDERERRTHVYRHRPGVYRSELILPDKAPEWARERGRLWNHVQSHVPPHDTVTAFDYRVFFPNRWDHERQSEAVGFFVREAFSERGVIADVAFHELSPATRLRPRRHAHILVVARSLDPRQPSGLSDTVDALRTSYMPDPGNGCPDVDSLDVRWAMICAGGPYHPGAQGPAPEALKAALDDEVVALRRQARPTAIRTRLSALPALPCLPPAREPPAVTALPAVAGASVNGRPVLARARAIVAALPRTLTGGLRQALSACRRWCSGRGLTKKLSL